ncbi:13026_t:CDS:2, partial [Rhizophagus irregularis]
IEFHFISKIKYESTWTETEDKAMKEETLLAIMEALNKYESDKILIAGERMYLVEAEHNITLENINNLSDEIKEFKKLKKNDVSSEYHELLDKLMIEGIICGVNFPEEFRKMAKDRGLFSVYPGGGRYKPFWS